MASSSTSTASGYLVAPTPAALRLAERGGEVSIETYLVVREDALQLYGFGDAAERELFEHLISVNGVGPKMAIAISRARPLSELRRAIVLEDTARFEAIPGSARRRRSGSCSSCGRRSPTRSSSPAVVGSDGVAARDALVELGWTVVEAERVLAEVDPELAPEERVREALRKAA